MSSSVQPFRDQKYHELKRQCIHQGRLFEDPEFPASDESLFYQKAPQRKVEWNFRCTLQQSSTASQHNGEERLDFCETNVFCYAKGWHSSR
uniref:Calpain catalytic domain-containing protein n=1 Tax=Coturnix japonica TaxID=93934 RepID=A0A8C2U2F5_COTJA